MGSVRKVIVYVKDTFMKSDYKIVEVAGRTYRIMILPVLSISNPNKHNEKRLVFDWGKSISHPQATVAFAILKKYGFYITRLVYNNKVYIINSIQTCRSGRKAAYITDAGQIDVHTSNIIDTLMAQEFPSYANAV